MPASSNDPARGVAGFVHMNTVGSGVTVSMIAWIEDGGAAPDIQTDPGTAGWPDRATWEGPAGTQFTLKVRRYRQQDIQAPTYSWVQFRNMDNAIIGGNIDLGTFGELGPHETTHTIHLDDSPASGVLNALRSGSLEIIVECGSTGGVDPWSVNSRSTANDPPAAALGGAYTWQRGYVRSRRKLEATTVSNVSAGGAEPTKLAYPDTIHIRHTATQDYRARVWRHTLSAPDGTVSYRHALSASGAGPNIDTTMGDAPLTENDRRVDVLDAGGSNVAFPAAETALMLKIFPDSPVRVLGASNADWEVAWDTTTEGWDVAVNEFMIQRTGRIAVDPRITLDQQLQHSDSVLRSDKDQGTSRLNSKFSFVGARVLNARGEGVIGPTVAYSFRDADNLTPAKTASGAASASDGEAGWGPTLQWAEAVPDGPWRNVVTVSDAAGTQHVETQTYSLLATNPLIRIVPGGGAGDAPMADHFSPGRTLIAGFSLFNTETGKLLTAADSLSDPRVALARFNLLTAQAEQFNGAAWVAVGTGALTFFPCYSPAALGLSTENLAYVATFGPVGAVYTVDTSGWTGGDIFIVARLYVNGTPYSAVAQIPVTGDSNRHSGQKFDPTGLFM